jgi:hypothetical protein
MTPPGAGITPILTKVFAAGFSTEEIVTIVDAGLLTLGAV